jgi:hypothetical protein
MSFYDGIKDVATVLKTAGNIELYQKLLDIGAQALEMQDELRRLTEENENLKKKSDLRPLIERHNESFITLKNDNQKLRYCSHCWDAEEKLIQLLCNEKSGTFECPHCEILGVFDVARNESTCSSSYAGRVDFLFE